LTCKGINVYNYGPENIIILMDMEGNILHRSDLDRNNLYFKTSPFSKFCKNGDIIAYFKDLSFNRFDWEANLIWTIKTRAHHYFDLTSHETIYALTRKDSIMSYRHLPVPVLEDFIYVISPEGKPEFTIPFLPELKDSISLRAIWRIYSYMLHPVNMAKMICRMFTDDFIFKASSVFDIMHTNSIEVIEKDVVGLCSKDDILLSIRDLDLIGIYNPKNAKFRWKWGPGEIDRQHHATFQENGNIMLFDNGPKRGFSRIIEVNPNTNTIEWEYTDSPKEKFFTSVRGSSQKLPNGNVLITESNGGRAFEITTDNRKVWEFYNPNIKEKAKSRGIIGRMFRITNPQDYVNIKDLN
jgi:hypothetical protein